MTAFLSLDLIHVFPEYHMFKHLLEKLSSKDIDAGSFKSSRIKNREDVPQFKIEWRRFSAISYSRTFGELEKAENVLTRLSMHILYVRERTDVDVMETFMGSIRLIMAEYSAI